VRYGQVPRELLPDEASAQANAAPTEVGSAKGTSSMMAEALPDPNATPATEAANPLEPKAAAKKKGRYAEHPEAPKKPKVKVAAAAPVASTVEETAAEKTQAAPLGLNGDTSKKKKKTKHTGPKQRLEEKPAAPAATPPALTQPAIPLVPTPAAAKTS
jgi:peptidyl-prolyl cis-trans isomerase SurA